ncbi:hypothetical protein CICLE_v10003013mg [Citrus x clementina]|uniref:Uncharacterized protein n=1 Tax=Citrus clementina TaxID=85681 RepID=V4SKL1_CITCL|nr:hypothetical protein CICLE_v10003013mg [Citrus x clementina]
MCAKYWNDLRLLARFTFLKCYGNVGKFIPLRVLSPESRQKSNNSNFNFFVEELNTECYDAVSLCTPEPKNMPSRSDQYELI